MSPRVEIYIHQHEISHEHPVMQCGDCLSRAHVQINGSVKKTITLLPSAPHLSGKWKAAFFASGEGDTTKCHSFASKGGILSIPLQSCAPDFVLE